MVWFVARESKSVGAGGKEPVSRFAAGERESVASVTSGLQAPSSNICSSLSISFLGPAYMYTKYISIICAHALYKVYLCMYTSAPDFLVHHDYC